MSYVNKNKIHLFILFFLSIPLFFLNIHNTHSIGGDDYAQYIKEAKNIANNKPYYQSNYVFNKYNNCYSPPQYPPGYPLLLAPVVKIWGTGIKPICYFNSVICACLLFLFFIYFSKYTSQLTALLLSLIITYSGLLIDLKQMALSDESGLLFVMLYLIFRNSPSFRFRRVLFLVIFATMAILIRTQSILLLMAEVVCFVIGVYKDYMRIKTISAKAIIHSVSLQVILGVVVLTFFLNKVVFYCPSSAFGFYVDFLKITLQKGIFTIIRDNVNFTIQATSAFFHYDTDNGIRTAVVTLFESFGLSFCVLGFIITVVKRFSFDDVFFIFLCFLMLYYPIHDARYFLPAIAIVYFYCFVALKKVLPAITNIQPAYIAVLITLIYFITGFRYLKSTTKTPYGYVPERKDIEAFQYISTHIGDSDLIICARPRMITLYTDKRCMIHAWQYDLATNKKIFDKMGANYLLLVKGIVNDYYYGYLAQYGHPTDSVALPGDYTLYKLGNATKTTQNNGIQ